MIRLAIIAALSACVVERTVVVVREPIAIGATLSSAVGDCGITAEDRAHWLECCDMAIVCPTVRVTS